MKELIKLNFDILLRIISASILVCSVIFMIQFLYMVYGVLGIFASFIVAFVIEIVRKNKGA